MDQGKIIYIDDQNTLDHKVSLDEDSVDEGTVLPHQQDDTDTD
jgi:hypothetical protein